MQRVDPDNWKGKVMFDQFAGMDVPFFSMTAQLDVTGLLNRSEAKKQSFFGLSLFAVSKALNAVEAMRYRLLENGQIVLYDTIDPSYIAMRSDGTITVVRVPFMPEYDAFETARQKEEKRILSLPEATFDHGGGRNVFFLSSIPWFSFSGMSHPVMLGKRYDSIVRVTLGKYRWEGKKALMPFDVHCHHGFVDGYRLAEVFHRIEAFSQAGTSSRGRVCGQTENTGGFCMG